MLKTSRFLASVPIILVLLAAVPVHAEDPVKKGGTIVRKAPPTPAPGKSSDASPSSNKRTGDDSEKWALLVGVDAYRKQPKLKYAVKDVQDLSSKLVEIGFKPEHVIVLHDNQGDESLRPTCQHQGAAQ